MDVGGHDDVGGDFPPVTAAGLVMGSAAAIQTQQLKVLSHTYTHKLKHHPQTDMVF